MIKCLTLRQPWASAVFDMGKTVENRAWVTPYRGLLAIQAGVSVDNSERARRVARALSDCPPGVVLGVVELYDIAPAPDNHWARQGMHHWRLRNARKLGSPVPCRGMPGLFAPPSDVLTAVWVQLGDL